MSLTQEGTIQFLEQLEKRGVDIFGESCLRILENGLSLVPRVINGMAQ